MKPVVLSYGNNQDECHRLMNSLAAWGWEYEILGIGESWKGWSHRLRTVWNRAEELRGKYTHVVHVDAYDVIANNYAHEFGDAWNTANYDNAALVLAAEVNCWPKKELAERHPPNPSPWKYAHSQWVLDLDRMDEVSVVGEIPDGYDDQLWLMERFLDWKYPIRLDYAGYLVQSTAFSHPWQAWFGIDGASSFDPVMGKDHVLNPVAQPLFLHANGGTDTSWWPK